jgi:hypothetical protein
MNPVDLIDYTNTKHKIPSFILDPHSKNQKDISLWKIFATHLLDSMMIFQTTIMISVILKLSLSTYMVSGSLSKAFDRINFSTLTMQMVPLICVSYYFFSYFFNHGQTWGMNTLKNRIKMEELNFTSSLAWTLFSFGVVMTGGLSLVFSYNWMQEKEWGKFMAHDHLYGSLIQDRELSPVNLVEHIQTNALQAEIERETFSKAA